MGHSISFIFIGIFIGVIFVFLWLIFRRLTFIKLNNSNELEPLWKRNKANLEYSEEEKINYAGQCIRNVGLYLLRYLISQIFVTFGLLISGIDFAIFYYVLYGIFSMILVVFVISEIYNAGNLLRNYKNLHKG